MPSVANMSLIWSDIGSYIKSSFRSDQDDQNTNAEPPKEETEVKADTADDTKSLSIEVKPLTPKKAEDKPLSRPQEAIKVEPNISNAIKEGTDATEEVTKSGMSKKDIETKPCLSKSSDSAKCASMEKVNKISSDKTKKEHIPSTDVNVKNDLNNIAQRAKVDQPKDPGILSCQGAEDKSNDICNDKSDTPKNIIQNKESHSVKKDIDIKLNKTTSDTKEEKQTESQTKSSVAKDESTKKYQSNEEHVNDTMKEQKNDTNKKTPNRVDTQIHKREVRDAVSASRSSSLLGKKRASSKSVPRKADYGKRALSLSDADKESSGDESDSENESNEKTLKTKSNKEEKSTLKKRRKEIKRSPEETKSNDDSDNSSFKDKPCQKDVPQLSSRKKSKAGAKRKPADLSSEALNQELEEIKRRKYINCWPLLKNER